MSQELEITTNEPRHLQLQADEVKGRVRLIQSIMRDVMIENTHYGVIPGTQKKALYKPGAEVLCVTFKLVPRFTVRRENLERGHREYECTATLSHAETGTVLGEGIGSCSTMESKYRYRIAARLCPTCGTDAILRGRQEYGGWYCNKRKGGCGANFKDGDPAIEQQEQGRIENPDISDQHNTVLKMAVKRALVAACLNTTAASDIFAQVAEDEEDSTEETPTAASIKPAQPIPPPQPAKPAQASQGSQGSPPYAFDPDMPYTGMIAKLTPRETEERNGKRRNIPGQIVLTTEHGPLQCFFWERPESLKALEDWGPLLGKPASLVFFTKQDVTGIVFKYVKEFQFATEAMPEMSAGETEGVAHAG